MKPRAGEAISLAAILATLFMCFILKTDANTNASVCPNRSVGTASLHQATGVVSNWLSLTTKPQSSVHRPKFLVHGWRWHTLSLIRDLKRLRLFSEEISANILNKRISEEDIRQLESASEFVINFNMKALHRIEEKTFFPWLQKKFLAPSMKLSVPDAPNDKEFQQAFEVILAHLDQERNKMHKMGISLKQQVDHICSITMSEISSKKDTGKELSYSHVKQFLSSASSLLSELHSSLEDAYQLQQNTIVPCIAHHVPLSEQKSLNNHVLQTLGLLESRTHLVGMHDTLQSIPNASIRKEELDLFRDVIPWLPRRMIPRWRTSLYEPKVGRLNMF